MVFAVSFPLVLGAIVAALSPRRILQSDLPSDPAAEGLDPSAGRINFLFLGLVAFSAPAVAGAQWALFKMLVRPAPGTLHALRLSDSLIYAFCPGIFMGFCVAALLLYHVCRWWFGVAFDRFLLKGDRDGAYYRQFNLIPWMSLGLGAVFLAANLLAADTYVELAPGKVAFSHFWDLARIEMPAGEVLEVREYRGRTAPNGTVSERPHLVFRFRNGTSYSTFDLAFAGDHDRLRAAAREAFPEGVPFVVDEACPE